MCIRDRRHDKVHLPAGTFQIFSSLFKLLGIRHLFLPPGHMVHPEPRPGTAQSLVPFFKIRLIRIQNSIMDIVASGASEGKQAASLQLIDQMCIRDSPYKLLIPPLRFLIQMKPYSRRRITVEAIHKDISPTD